MSSVGEALQRRSRTSQAVRDTAYARAMLNVTRAFPADNDAHVLHVGCADERQPVGLLPCEVGEAQCGRRACIAKYGIEAGPEHAGACHFYIHAVEAAHPELAVPCAERLPDLMPGAGHIVLMPAHIFIRVGRYEDAIDRNVHALHADEQHIPDLAPDGAYRLGYYPHNAHFLWFAATMAGREQTAIDAAIKTPDLTNKEMMRGSGLGALQHYLVTPLFAYVRFSRWQDVLQAEAPAPDLPYPMGIWHYARSLAYTATEDFARAEAELKALREQRAHPALKDVTIWGFNSGSAILDIAIEAAAGELALKQGRTAEALAHFRKGLEIEDKLGYDEPPTWHLPVRQQLGAALLVAGDREAAARMFAEDLERHPKNVWSLAGINRPNKSTQ